MQYEQKQNQPPKLRIHISNSGAEAAAVMAKIGNTENTKAKLLLRGSSGT